MPPFRRVALSFRHLVPVVLVVLFVVILVTKGCGGDEPAEAPKQSAPPPVAARAGASDDEETTIGLFERASGAVVHVSSLRYIQDLSQGMDPMEVPAGTGTGFLWDDEGHVVTNFHVVAEAGGLRVLLKDGSTHDAQVVGVARSHDIAVLETDVRARGLPRGNSSGLRVGQRAYAIGCPFGLDQTLTTGIVSGLGREIRAMTGRPIPGVIQTDASINPGNSGGPLLDSTGRVIGMTTAIISPSGASAGIGFAIPVDTMSIVVPQILARRGNFQRPILGVKLLPDGVAQANGIEGALVGEIDPGSPAARAGIVGTRQRPGQQPLAGDSIVALDGVPVRTSDDLHRFMDTKRIGDPVEVTLRRDGKDRKVQMMLASGE